jgi:hypothetical protein
LHRFPVNTDLSYLVDREVVMVAIGQLQVQIELEPQAIINLTGGWALKSAEGRIIDSSRPHAERASWKIPWLLGKKVSGYQVMDERRICILFDTMVLEGIDDSDEVETFAVALPDFQFVV